MPGLCQSVCHTSLAVLLPQFQCKFIYVCNKYMYVCMYIWLCVEGPNTITMKSLRFSKCVSYSCLFCTALVHLIPLVAWCPSSSICSLPSPSPHPCQDPPAFLRYLSVSYTVTSASARAPILNEPPPRWPHFLLPLTAPVLGHSPHAGIPQPYELLMAIWGSRTDGNDMHMAWAVG